MKKLILIVIAVALACQVGAVTIHVPSEVSSIQSALNASETGDTVLVAPGTYNEFINYPGNRVTLLSSDGPEVTIISAPSDAATYFINAEYAGEGSKLEGFTITGAQGANAVVWLLGTDHFEITNNRFVDNDAVDCIRSYGQAQTPVVRNLIVNSATNYAIVTYSPNGICTGNTVYGGANGLLVHGHSSKIINNIVVGVSGSAITDPDPSSQVDYNDFWNNGVNGDPGSAGFSADPLFVDALTNNFHLQVFSPCIDAGHPAPIYDDPDGSRSDIGAYLTEDAGPAACMIGMTSEDMSNVINHAPMFEWTFYDPAGGVQAAFELEVGTDMDWWTAEMWSTGEVWTGSESIMYAGLPLEDGQSYFFRIRVNNGVEWGAWVHRAFTMNSLPEAPTPDYPVADEPIRFDYTFLRILNAVDPEGDPLAYDFEIYADPSLTVVVSGEYGVGQQSEQTTSGIFPELTIGAQYWWRSRSHDGYEYSPWSAAESFLTRDTMTINVPGDYGTIQQGIDYSADGDTVQVAPGIYYEMVNFNGKQVVLISSHGPELTVIQRPVDDMDHIATGMTGGADAVAQEPAAELTATVSFVNGEGAGAVLDGFSIHNVFGYGVYCAESSPVIQNCDISLCTGPAGGAGILCGNSRALIRYNRIHHNRAVAWPGVGATGPIVPEVCYNLIYENVATNASGIGLYGADSNFYVHHNILWHNGNGDEDGYGALWVRGTNGRIVSNTIVSNYAGGIQIVDGTGVMILNNVAVSNDGDGITPGSAYYDYNDIWNNALSNAPGPNGISADPLFLNAAEQDFTLMPGSPCIDAGHPDPEYNDPDGTRGDMGALPTSYDLPAAVYPNLLPDEFMHVLNHTPTIQWTFIDTVGSQAAYEIEVGTDDDWTVAEMWSTGAVFSSDEFAVYNGDPLQDGATYCLRVRLNNGSNWGSWSNREFRMNSVPSTPEPDFPTGQVIIRPLSVYLRVANSTDAENDIPTYSFEVYGDAALSVLVAGAEDITQQTDFTAWGPVPDMEPGMEYWWRSRSFDGYELSAWSAAESFLADSVYGRAIHVPQEIPTIQEAINIAQEGDTVLVAPGTYAESIDFLGKIICVCSEGGREVTFIAPDMPEATYDSLRVEDTTAVLTDAVVFDVVAAVNFTSGESAFSILEGFTINNPTGRGIYCYGSSPTIRYCDISQCYVGYADGAGVFCLESGAVIQYNRIHHNQCEKTGAGIGGSGSAALEVSHNLIYNNNSGHGAGIGIIAPAANVNIHHNVVVDNTCQTDGMGAVYINGMNSRINNNTVFSNTKGISIYQGGGTGVQILNNIVASNTYAGIEPSVAYYDYNDAWDNPAANDPGPNGISLDPLFANAAAGDFALLEPSPCIDAGHPDPIYNDPDGTRNDTGAYYFGQSVTCCLLRGDIDHDGALTPVDIVYFVDWLWGDGPAPPCMDEADVNGDGGVDPTDCLYLANYMWRSGPAPVPCP